MSGGPIEYFPVDDADDGSCIDLDLAQTQLHPAASRATSGAAANAPRPPPPAPRPKKPTRSAADFNDTTAQRARIRPAPELDLIGGAEMPLQPQEVFMESNFALADDATTRRFTSVRMHGDVDLNFDADDYPATADYRSRLERDGVGGPDEGEEPRISEERHAFMRLKERPEAVEAFLKDIQHPKHAAHAKRNAIRPAQPARHVLHEKAKPYATASAAQRAAVAMADSTARADFFTGKQHYNAPPGFLEKRREEQTAAMAENFRAVVEQLEKELAAAPPGAMGERLRTELEMEKFLLTTDPARLTSTAAGAASAAGAAAGAAGSSAAGAAGAAVAAASTAATAATAAAGGLPGAPVLESMLSLDAARDLFDVDPLTLLPVDLRGNFMSMPEISATWRLLYPLVIQAEKYRTHFNAVELVRAMARCGAKFDGCVRLSTRERLGALLNAEFFANDLHPDGTLRGEHEHYDIASASTNLIVFKFYVVRRNKQNLALVGRTLDESTADKTKLAKDAAADRKKAEEFMNLNPRGLLDLEKQIVDHESDGTEESGNLHSIRYLAREFMFCIRIVCVEPPAGGGGGCCHSAVDLCASEEDEERNPNDHNVSFFEDDTAAAAVEADVDDDDDGDYQTRPFASSLSSYGSEAVSRSDAQYFIHSDDEDDGDARRHKRAEHASIPSAKLRIGQKVAEHCVGKWKAEAFAYQINAQTVRRLCVRSFLYYSGGSTAPK